MKSLCSKVLVRLADHLALPSSLLDELSVNKRDSGGFFSKRLVGRYSDRSNNSTDSSLIHGVSFRGVGRGNSLPLGNCPPPESSHQPYVKVSIEKGVKLAVLLIFILFSLKFMLHVEGNTSHSSLYAWLLVMVLDS